MLHVYILLLIFMLLLMPNLNILPHIKKGEIVGAIDLGFDRYDHSFDVCVKEFKLGSSLYLICVFELCRFARYTCDSG